MVHNIRQLAQRIRFTKNVEVYVRNIPESGATIKEIREKHNLPPIKFNVRWVKDHEIIAPLAKNSNKDHTITWGRGPRWTDVINHLNEMDR